MHPHPWPPNRCRKVRKAAWSAACLSASAALPAPRAAQSPGPAAAWPAARPGEMGVWWLDQFPQQLFHVLLRRVNLSGGVRKRKTQHDDYKRCTWPQESQIRIRQALQICRQRIQEAHPLQHITMHHEWQAVFPCQNPCTCVRGSYTRWCWNVSRAFSNPAS
jgi:hypothetical protein